MGEGNMSSQQNHPADSRCCGGCTGHRPKHGFHCPERLPASVADNLFGSPLIYPKRKPTPRFSSPNSPLSPKELIQLQECIEASNELLRSLGNPRDHDNLSALRIRLRMLRGISVRVETSCGGAKQELAGCLQEAGRDFLQLYNEGQKEIVPFSRICSVSRSGEKQVCKHDQELADIPLSLRRSLVLGFGEVVSKSPFLINIFFGLPLHLHLLVFLGCTVRVQTDHEVFFGILAESEEGYIHLRVNNHIQQINIDKICHIVLLKDGVKFE